MSAWPISWPEPGNRVRLGARPQPQWLRWLALGSLLACLLADVQADTAWQPIGRLQRDGDPLAGELSLSLPSLNKRSGHHELWERLRYPETDRPEQRTLWAVRCRAGVLAKVLEASNGEFSARADPLRFYVPLPDSAGAAIVDIACREVKRRLAAGRPEASATASAVDSAGTTDVVTLIRPPSYLEQGDFDQDDD